MKKFMKKQVKCLKNFFGATEADENITPQISNNGNSFNFAVTQPNSHQKFVF